MDNELFELAVQASIRVPPKNVIGTKTEHRLHAAMKYYFQPDDRFHEIKINGYICDAVSEDESSVYEIQTRAFERLQKKLSSLLLEHTVTVIHPIITEKRIIVTYTGGGEVSIRKSPKKRTAFDVFEELYKIKKHLGKDRLVFKLVMLKADEFRTYKGTKAERKAFAKPISVERIPTDLTDIISIDFVKDFSYFLPEHLPEYFDCATYAKLCGITKSLARTALNVLSSLGVVKRIGKLKNAYIYEVAK